MEHTVADWLARSSYPGVFALLLACGLGAPLSEEVIIVLGGVVVGHGRPEGFVGMAVTAYLGQVAGDLLLFLVGRRLGPKAQAQPRFRGLLTPKRVAWLERHFAAHGVWTIFWVRFIPGLRAPAFLMAGMGRQRPRTFLLADGGAALLTAPALTYLGYHFGVHVLRGLALATHWLMFGVAAALLATLVYGLVRRHGGRPPGGPGHPGPGASLRSPAAG